MLQRTLSFFIITFIIATPINLFGIRHSKTKKREPIKKYTVKKEDSLDLATILAKQTKDLTFEQAYKAKEYHIREKNQEMIIKCAQRMLAVGGDQELMRTARIELADLSLLKGNYKDAEKYGLEYQKYYPGALEAKKASYIAIRANFLSKLSSDRDQEKTHTAIRLAKEFLATYKDDTEYTPQINEMIEQCYKSLIRAELHVIHTQLNAYHYSQNEGSLAAAEKRITYIKETFLPHAPTAEKKVTLLGLELEKLRRKLSIKEKSKQKTSEEETLHVAYDGTQQESSLSYIKDFLFEDNDAFFA